MLWRKKPQAKPPRASSERARLTPYSYHGVRSNQDNGIGRNIKSAGVKQLSTARKLWLEKFGFIILAIAVVASLISLMYVSTNAQVVTQGNVTVNFDYSTEVEKAASKLISGSILNRDKITINTTKIDASLESSFPMYSRISLILPLVDHHPIIYLTRAQPALLLNNTLGQYVINENGQVMLRDTNKDEFSGLQIPQVNYPGYSYLNTGQQVLTSNEVQFVQVIVYELSLKGEKIATMDFVQGTSEVNVYIAGKSYYVKFNLENNDPRQQVGSFLATQHYLMTQNITPSQYIDVRTDGRVYYQ